MMETILAPTDFSPSSLNAVNYAADLAVAIKAKLVLFHAIPFPIAVSEISVPENFIEEMTEIRQHDLDELADKIKQRTKGEILISKGIKIGTVEQEIDRLSQKEKPLAIVMGIKSGKTLERALMGSSIFHIMNHTGYPTLIIPENIRFISFHEIGIACDFRKSDDSLPFKSIKSWLSLFKANLSIINITAAKKEFNAEKLSESISLQNRLNTFHPHFHLLTGNDIAEELNEFVITHHLDLLILFPKNHGIFNIFHKKISKKITTLSHLPILAIHEKETQ